MWQHSGTDVEYEFWGQEPNGEDPLDDCAVMDPSGQNGGEDCEDMI